MQFLHHSQDPVMAEKLDSVEELDSPSAGYLLAYIIAVFGIIKWQPQKTYSLQEVMYNQVVPNSVQDAALGDSNSRNVPGYVFCA